MPAAVAMNTHFSHISCRISSLSRASKPALRIAEAMASIRGDREPSSSPKLSACQSLRWTTAPSAPSVVEMAHCPPSTRSGPKRSMSRSMCRMPFKSGKIAVAGPTALAKDVIAPSRSNALQLRTTRSNGSVRFSCSTIGGEARWKSPTGLRIVRPVLRKLGGPTRTNEKRHVATGVQQTPAEIAADRARSDNKNSHVIRILYFK